MKSPLTHAVTAFAACHLLAGSSSALTPFTDEFNATKLDTSRWSLTNAAKGKLALKSGRLNFTVASPPSDDDYAFLDLRNNQPRYSESWQVILDVSNTANVGSRAGTGIWVFNAADDTDGVFLEFYGAGQKGGFTLISVTNDQDNPAKDITKNPGVTSGAMRISFDKTTRLFTFWYDATGSSNGFQWVKMCTFSPTGKGGTRNGNWNMNATSGKFGIRIFGYAEKQIITAGKMTLDHFVLKAM